MSSSVSPTAGTRYFAVAAEELERLLTGRLVRTVFQPIVDLASGAVVGYEALARGPVGSPLERPDVMFDVARQAGRTRALDELCRETALASALDVGLRAPLTLFVNVEPAALDVRRLSSPAGVLARAQQQLRVVVEVTERDLTTDPAELLAVVARVRELGWAIALDDVGADPRSLALMPLLAPEVIKLDLALVQQRPGLATAEIIAAVSAEVERSGSVVLAEGIETAAHADLARGMAPPLEQRWWYGRPHPLLTAAPTRRAARPLPAVPLALPARAAPASARGSVFALASGGNPVRRVTKPLLVAVSQQLERQALALGNLAIVLAAFEDARYFTPDTERRYAQLASISSFVGAMARGLSAHPAPGVRGAHLRSDDPIVGEWDVVVLGPHFAAALVAKDLGDARAAPRRDGTAGSPVESNRHFDYILTYDRQQVTAIATALMTRMQPRGLPRQRAAR